MDHSHQKFLDQEHIDHRAMGEHGTMSMEGHAAHDGILQHLCREQQSAAAECPSGELDETATAWACTSADSRSIYSCKCTMMSIICSLSSCLGCSRHTLLMLLTPPVRGHAHRLVHIHHLDHEQHQQSDTGMEEFASQPAPQPVDIGAG